MGSTEVSISLKKALIALADSASARALAASTLASFSAAQARSRSRRAWTKPTVAKAKPMMMAAATSEPATTPT